MSDADPISAPPSAPTISPGEPPESDLEKRLDLFAENCEFMYRALEAIAAGAVADPKAFAADMIKAGTPWRNP